MTEPTHRRSWVERAALWSILFTVLGWTVWALWIGSAFYHGAIAVMNTMPDVQNTMHELRTSLEIEKVTQSTQNQRLDRLEREWDGLNTRKKK